MGREIRQVPPDWEHPKAQHPWGYDYTPLLDESYEEALEEWEEKKRAWDAGERPKWFIEPPHGESYTFEEYEGEAPNPDYYRPRWPEESRTHIQIYETVSEGTPVSPVFSDKEEAIEWVIENWGRSPDAARQFVETGWAPSFVMNVGDQGTRISDPDAGAWEPEFIGKKEER
jgi:hypothetical protein